MKLVNFHIKVGVIALLGLLTFGQAWGETYYVWKNGQTGQAACAASVVCYSATGWEDASPTGVGDLEAVVEVATVGTGDIVLISGGPVGGVGITYTGTEIDSDSTLGVDEAVAYIGAPRPTDTGYALHGGVVTLNNNDVGAATGVIRPEVHCGAAGACIIGRLTLLNGPAGSYGAYTSGNNWQFDDLTVTDVERGIGVIGATGVVINRPAIYGTTYPIYSTAACTINYGYVYGNSNTVWINGGNTIINNVNFIGNTLEAITSTGISSPVINNSIFVANVGGNAAKFPINEGGTGEIICNDCLVLPNPGALANLSTGTVTFNNPVYKMPLFTRGNRPAIAIFGVDDYTSLAYFRDTVAPKLKSYGWGGTFALNYSAALADWSDLIALSSAGHTIAGHAATYVNLMTSRTGLSMTYAGAAAAADCAVTDSGGDYATVFSCVNDAETVISLNLALAANDTLDEVVAVVNSGTVTHGYTAAKRNTDFGNAVASKYLTTQSQNVKAGAKNYDLADARVINGEIRDVKAWIESGLGTTINGWVCPGNASDTTIRAGLLAKGFTGARGDGTTSTNLMESINIFNITPVSLFSMFGNDADPQNTANKVESYVGSTMEYLKYTGGVKFFYAHTTAELSAAGWDAVLAEVAKSGVMVMTLDAAVAYLKTYDPSADLATADNLTYTRTMVNNPDYRLRAGSPAIDAGTPITGPHTAGSKVITGGDFYGITKLYGAGVDIGNSERKKHLFDEDEMIPKTYTVPAE